MSGTWRPRNLVLRWGVEGGEGAGRMRREPQRTSRANSPPPPIIPIGEEALLRLSSQGGSDFILKTLHMGGRDNACGTNEIIPNTLSHLTAKLKVLLLRAVPMRTPQQWCLCCAAERPPVWMPKAIPQTLTPRTTLVRSLFHHSLHWGQFFHFYSFYWGDSG